MSGNSGSGSGNGTDSAHLRDSIRAEIFKHREIQSKEVTFRGVKLEIRQPTLDDILSAQDSEDRKTAILQTLVRHAYIPGTEERVFEDGDIEMLLRMPFDKEFIEISQAIGALSDTNFLAESAASPKTQSDMPS